MKSVSFIRTAPTALGEPKSREGYQSPLSLDELLVTHPTSTFFVRVGEDVDSPNDGLGVTSGDLLVVDRAVVATLGRLVLALVEGELVVCRYTEHNSERYLVAGTPKPKTIEITDNQDVMLWGVVTAVVRGM